MMRIAFTVAAVLLAACQPAGTGTTDRSSVEPTAAAGVSATGLDAMIMASMVAAAEELPRLRGMLVLRDGETLAEHRFNGGPPLDRPVNIKSASKTVLSILAGIAIERGVLQGVDQSVVSVLASDAPANPDPRLSTVTVGHLLSMRAGLERTSGEYYGRWVTSPNWVRFALSRPFADEPGGQMLYSTGSSHLLSAMLTRASGRSTHALAQDWLAAPLDIEIPQWPRDPQGVYFGGNDMLMSPEGLAQIGELYRNGGRAGEAQIVPQHWIEESWTPRTSSPWSGDAYGYGWFMSEVRGHPVRYGRGYGGQMLYVVPDLGLTVVMTSDPAGDRDSPHVQALHRLLADGIIPAAEKGG